MRALARARCGKGFVLGDGGAGDLAAIHAFKRDQHTGFVSNRDTHRHPDFIGAVARAFDQDIGILNGQAFDGQHWTSPGTFSLMRLTGGILGPAPKADQSDKTAFRMVEGAACCAHHLEVGTHDHQVKGAQRKQDGNPPDHVPQPAAFLIACGHLGFAVCDGPGRDL